MSTIDDGMRDPVREIPLMWPDDNGSYGIRVLLDHGEGCREERFTWDDGEPVKASELDRVARQLLQCESVTTRSSSGSER
jgi:hypothetical protein